MLLNVISDGSSYEAVAPTSRKDTDPQSRHDAVLGDGLQETRSSGQTLQSRSAGGEEGANHNHPRRRPGQRAYHQVPVNSFPKPAEDGRRFLEEHPVSRFVLRFPMPHHQWTHLSLRTTPSMQAPNSTTLDMSGWLWIKESWWTFVFASPPQGGLD